MDSDMELSHLEQQKGDEDEEEGEGNEDEDEGENDHEYDSNDDGVARALLTQIPQTRGQGMQPTTRTAATLWNQIGGIVVEVSIFSFYGSSPFNPGTLGITDALFHNNRSPIHWRAICQDFRTVLPSPSSSSSLTLRQHWNAMTSINELIVIVLAILNLKGNIEMNLSARLGTAANLGDLDVPSIRNSLILGNLALIQVQAAVISFIAACFPFLLGVIFPGVGEGPPESVPAHRRNLFYDPRSLVPGHSHRAPLPVPPPPTGVSKSGFNEYVFDSLYLHRRSNLFWLCRFMVVASTAMSAACLSAVLLGSFMSGLVVLCRKLGRDPGAAPVPTPASNRWFMFFL